MIEYLAARGFGYGSGMLSPDNSKFIVNIPKNASSFLEHWASKQGWTSATVGDNCNWQLCKELIIVLRDPVDRWISGLSQYINGYILNPQGPNGPVKFSSLFHPANNEISADDFVKFYNPVVERLIFDIINRFDDHVWPQCEFFHDLLPNSNKKFFYIDNLFANTVSAYLGWSLNHSLDSNSAKNTHSLSVLGSFFRNILSQRPDLKQRVAYAYSKDYDLIATIFPEKLSSTAVDFEPLFANYDNQ